MAHYINKDALVAEIEKLLDKGKHHDNYQSAFRDGNNSALYALKGRINTLEVKEMQEEPVSIDFEHELYKAFGQVKDFTLGMRIAKWFYDIGKNSQEPASGDLGEYINELSKQFPEVSFAKLSRIAVRVAKWKEQQLMANAVEGVVHHFEKCKVASVHYNDPTGVPMAYFTSPEGLSVGDKVKINVIKED